MDQSNAIKLEVGVKALVKNAEGRYLILKRSKPYPGLTEPMWDLPGGRIIPGEPILRALAREIMEETSMEMTGEPRLLHAQDILRVEGKHTVRLTFEAQAHGEVTLDPMEHTEFKWVTLEEMKNSYHDAYLDPVLNSIS